MRFIIGKPTIKLYFERWYPFLGTSILCLILFYFRNKSIVISMSDALYDSTFLTAILTALSIIFGFLLTSLATIYNSESKPVQALKDAGRFKELIAYNKTAVKWIFFSVILTSIFLLSFKIENTIPYYEYFGSLWVYTTIYAMFLSYRFLGIFYALI